MNLKYLTAVLFNAIIFCPALAQSSKDSSIALLYEGSLLRQVPIVVFYMPYAGKTIYDSAHVFKFQVTEEEYRDLENRIKVMIKLPKDSSLPSPYEFIIRKNGSLQIVSTFSLPSLKETFRYIAGIFSDSYKRMRIEKVLRNVYKYMEFE